MMAQYLAHEPVLANSGTDTAAAGRMLLAQTYVPFGNAAWAGRGQPMDGQLRRSSRWKTSCPAR